MIIYTCRTKKIPTTPDFIHNDTNALKMFRYNKDLMKSCGSMEVQDKVTKDVYYTYTTLVNFNNMLDSDVDNAFMLVNNYLVEHEEVKDSLDRKCQSYYDKLKIWYNRYNINPTDDVLKTICEEVKVVMSYLKRLEIIKESSCNLKRNYNM